MSGGYWNYQDQKIDESFDLMRLMELLKGLKKCFHCVDWAESGDTLRKDAEKEIYEILLSLGDSLFI